MSFTPPIRRYADLIYHEKPLEYYVLQLIWYYPMLLRPGFGWICDHWYPFDYRFKSYGIISCCIAFGLFALVELLEFKTFPLLFTCLLSLNCMLMESTTIGLATIVFKLEQQLIIMMHPDAIKMRDSSFEVSYPALSRHGFKLENGTIKRSSFLRTYGLYILFNQGSLVVWMVIGVWLSQAYKYNKETDISDNMPGTLGYVYAASSVLVFLFLLLFKEKKEKVFFKPMDWPESLKLMFGKRNSLLVYIPLLIMLNPILNHSSYMNSMIQNDDNKHDKLCRGKTGDLDYKEDFYVLNALSSAYTIVVLLAIITLIKKVKRKHFAWLLLLPTAVFLTMYTLKSYVDVLYKSEYFIFVYDFFGIDHENMIIGISKIFLIDMYGYYIPENYQFTFINLLTTVPSVGKRFGTLAYAALYDKYRNSYNVDCSLNYTKIAVILDCFLLCLVLPAVLCRMFRETQCKDDSQTVKDKNKSASKGGSLWEIFI